MAGAIIVPVYREAARLSALLNRLQPLRQQGWCVVVVDGGSDDDSRQLAAQGADIVLQAARGRAAQMNAGWRSGPWDPVVFLHADTQLPDSFTADLAAFVQSDAQWGRFDVTLSGQHPAFRVIGWFMNQRSRLTGIATGDQTLFFRRSLLIRLDGFANQPLMEDVELCRRASRVVKPWCCRSRVITSSRKWEAQGIVRTVALMWWIRLAYWLGVSPQRLHRWYYGRSR